MPTAEYIKNHPQEDENQKVSKFITQFTKLNQKLQPFSETRGSCRVPEMIRSSTEEQKWNAPDSMGFNWDLSPARDEW